MREPMKRLSLLLLALPLTASCGFDASGLTPDDQFDALGDDATVVDALFEVAPGDDASPETADDTSNGDAPLFEAGDGGCLDPKLDCPAPPACHTASCTSGVCGTTQDTSGTTCSGGKCDSTGACVQCLAGTDCPAATPVCTKNACVAASCTDGKKDGGESDVDCGGSTSCARCPLGGACTAGGDCKSGKCAGGKCVCAQDSDCGSGDYCDNGTCKAQLTQGTKCAAANQCTTGNCVDGVCCDTACNGACVTCLAAQKSSGPDGTCGAVKDGTDPYKTCTAAPPCGETGQCAGGACAFAPTTTRCGAASCSGTKFTPQSFCSGKGSCNTATPADCSPYVCAPAGCKKPCGGNGDCVSGYTCTLGTCVALLANGAVCAGGGQCASGNCVWSGASSVCCDQPCDKMCTECATGTCKDVPSGMGDMLHAPICVSATNQACDGKGNCLGTTGYACTSDGQCLSGTCNLTGGSGKGTCA